MSVDIDLTGWLETTLPRVLPAFLQEQRWFGGKAKAIARVDFEDAVWIADGGRPCALVIVNVRYAQAVHERYALSLAFDRAHPNLPKVGQLEPPGSDAWVWEASTDPTAALALLNGFSSPARDLPMVRGGKLRYRDTSGAAMRPPRAAERPTVRPVGAEQSNTSLIVDRTLVFKLFRRLEDGENPELEIGRFLTTHTSFRAVPTLRGSLTYVPARGESSTLGVLQDWVDNRGDGWSHVVGLLEQAGGSTADTLGRDLFALGETTADLHAALSIDTAVPAFAPEPVTGSDIEDWRASLLERVSSTLGLVERNMPAWSEDARQLGDALLDARVRAAALVHVPELRAAPQRFRKIRIHGDFHLGQTLKTTEGFVVIDFEGEPARSLADRRLKQCALKDVAGMIRSFDYAVETAGPRDTKMAPESLSTPHLRASFLGGYREAARRRDDTVFLPTDPRALDQWIEFFELEKALYEVEYEINNRPDWVHIPLRGILRILGRRS